MRDRRRACRRFGNALLLGILLGCSGVTEQTLSHATVTTLGPAGGSILLPDSISLVVVPAGALAANVAFTTSRVTVVPASGLLIQGTAYAIEPGVRFAVPATLRLSYARASLPPGVLEPELAVHRVEGR
jgi:hypothetical protein